jgi:radical SAM-linked protein
VILRIRATKLGKVRFVSHRDMASIWERVLRRCGVPVATSEGFTPRPRISFGLALPTGAESFAEYVDVALRAGASLDADDRAELTRALSAAMPVGVDVLAVVECEPGGGSLQEIVTSCTWELWHDELVDAAAVDAACRLLEAAELPLERERKGVRRTDDVRPLVLDLRRSGDGRRVVADLATTGRALRPAELAQLAFTGVDPVDVRVLRTHQWIGDADDRREVCSLPVDVAALTAEASA